MTNAFGIPQFTPTLHADELEWFVQNAPSWNWRWARTFAKSSPHSYVMKTKNLNDADYERAVRFVIATGHPTNYYKRVNIELHLPTLTMDYGAPGAVEEETGFKFWPMSHKISDSRAFNTAPYQLSYGRQTAKQTWIEGLTKDSQFDFAAPHWDDALLTTFETYRSPLWRALKDGDRAMSSYLEVGPGTAQLADLKLLDPGSRYRVVGESRGQLNVATYKHNLQDMVPMEPNAYLNSWFYPANWVPQIGEHDVVVALFGAASFLTPESVRAAYDSTRERLVLMHHTAVSRSGVEALGIQVPETARESYQAARELPGAETMKVGDYLMTTVRKR